MHQMKEYWDILLFELCKVDVVCWQGEPNWLGWVVIAIPILILIRVIKRIWNALESYNEQTEFRKSSSKNKRH